MCQTWRPPWGVSPAVSLVPHTELPTPRGQARSASHALRQPGESGERFIKKKRGGRRGPRCWVRSAQFKGCMLVLIKKLHFGARGCGVWCKRCPSPLLCQVYILMQVSLASYNEYSFDPVSHAENKLLRRRNLKSGKIKNDSFLHQTLFQIVEALMVCQLPSNWLFGARFFGGFCSATSHLPLQATGICSDPRKSPKTTNPKTEGYLIVRGEGKLKGKPSPCPAF